MSAGSSSCIETESVPQQTHGCESIRRMLSSDMQRNAAEPVLFMISRIQARSMLIPSSSAIWASVRFFFIMIVVARSRGLCFSASVISS